jgi:hypothetical protein
MSDEIKAFNLGLLLMTVVGEDVLRRAVEGLGPLIAGPPADDPPILAQAVSLNPAQLVGLLEFCVALAPRRAGGRSIQDQEAALAAAADRVDGDAKKNVIRLAMLRAQFGSDTLVQALRLLAACAAPVRASGVPITDADVAPGPAAPRPPPEIRILGWGSLLWETDETDPEAHLRFKEQHCGWERQGPTLPLEFSGISTRRKGALTLVIDRAHGRPVAVSSARSRREEVGRAVADLRAREGGPEEHLGFVDLASGERRGRDAEAVRTIEEWANEHHVGAVVWADFEPAFGDPPKRPWSIKAALDYLRSLPESGRAEAKIYLERAPEFVKTPLRKAVVDNPPWDRATTGETDPV